jgi:hypothetical protein
VASTCKCDNEASGSVNWGEILDYLRTVSFLRRTQLHAVSMGKSEIPRWIMDWLYWNDLGHDTVMATGKVNEETLVAETGRKFHYELSECQHLKYDCLMWGIGIRGNGKIYKLDSDWAIFTINFVLIVYFLPEEGWIIIKIKGPARHGMQYSYRPMWQIARVSPAVKRKK